MLDWADPSTKIQVSTGLVEKDDVAVLVEYEVVSEVVEIPMLKEEPIVSKVCDEGIDVNLTKSMILNAEEVEV